MWIWIGLLIVFLFVVLNKILWVEEDFDYSSALLPKWIPPIAQKMKLESSVPPCHNCRQPFSFRKEFTICSYHPTEPLEFRIYYCRTCRPFFLAYSDKHRYMCFSCVTKRCHDQLKYKKVLMQHWDQTVGRLLEPYVCRDVSHLIWHYYPKK